MTTSPASPETSESAPSPTARIVFFIAAISASAIDLATKWAAFSAVAASAEGRVVIWPGRFEFLARYNDAGIWSIGYGTVNSNLVFAGLACLVIPLVAGWALWTLRPDQRGLSCLLGFIVGGAIGNAYDRFVHGGVRDFIQVYLWNNYAYPTFNVADSFLVCSVATLILGQWWTGRAEAKRRVALAS